MGGAFGDRTYPGRMSDIPTPSTTPAPGWFPDPHRRHELRWWDGSQWTNQVSSGGQQGWDDPTVPLGRDGADRVQRQVQAQAGVAPTAGQGGGTVFTEPVLVVNQKAKLIELSNEYAVYDQHGRQIAGVRQTGQTAARKVLRALTSIDQFLTHTLEIADLSGTTLLRLTRPGKVFKSTVIVENGPGQEVGRIVQQNVFGKIRFALESDGHTVGSINAENWRAWNFSIRDHTDTEVARITKTWEGLAKTLFTTADNYVVQIHRPLEEPLRSLVVAAALSVDTALKQDERGFN